MDGAEETAEESKRRTAVARALRKGRNGLELTQKALAKKAGIGYSTLRGIEQNRDEGKRHRPLTLKTLSLAIDRPEDFLNNIQEGQIGRETGDVLESQSEETSDELEPTDSVVLRSFLDAVAPRLDEIVIARLNEIVVPRLDKIDTVEVQVRALMAAFHSSKNEIAVDFEYPGSEQDA
ncbi:MAG TPA: helix-turn-helix transcriptional regulator [Streptosporangiaceae bacterium]|nr:helix-turn-helix transcriptional regulator [Streptosporangiaceae bacterium]